MIHFPFIDIWKLKVDETAEGFIQLASFIDYEGSKGSNPVVSAVENAWAFNS